MSLTRRDFNKLALAWHLGTRDVDHGREFIMKLSRACGSHEFQITTDGQASFWRRQRNKWLNQVDWMDAPGAAKGATVINELSVITSGRAATLYVFFDDRAALPPWLAAQFTDTGWDIGLDEGRSPERDLSTDTGPGRSVDTVFSVWKRTLDGPGSVTLGAMVDTSSGKAMYGIAAKADDR